MIRQTLHHLRKLPRDIRARVSQHLIAPATLLAEVPIAEGDTVLEIGNPVGFFATASLQTVGRAGRVIVAGPNVESFDYVAGGQRVEHVLLADILTGKALKNQTTDWIILTNLLSSSLHPDQFCIAVGAYLKPTGKVVLLDWREDQIAGPEASRRFSREGAIKMLAGCGLEFERTLKTPLHHYGLVFRPQAQIR